MLAAKPRDELAAQRVRTREAEIGRRPAQAQRYGLYGAPLSIAREVGRFLYVLAVSTGARRIVEFGRSLGVSSISILQPRSATVAAEHSSRASVMSTR